MNEIDLIIKKAKCLLDEVEFYYKKGDLDKLDCGLLRDYHKISTQIYLKIYEKIDGE